MSEQVVLASRHSANGGIVYVGFDVQSMLVDRWRGKMGE